MSGLKEYRTPMFRIDEQPAPIRAVVHEYGWEFVNQMLQLGVTSSSRMLHIARSLHGGHGAGIQIRGVPNEGEEAGVAERLANVYGRKEPSPRDDEAARQIVGFMWSKYHWGRCLCVH